MKTKLQQIIKNNPYSLKAVVAHEALDHDILETYFHEGLNYERIESFFRDILNHGCVSGMIPSLIYTVDTHKFYDKYYYEVEALREECEDSIGEPIKIQGDLKNFFAWFAFEETAYRLAQELKLDI